jgi:sec-independent protein translocase protein TatA
MNGQVVGLFGQLGTGEIVLILGVLILLFGAKKLPDLARAIGKSARELRSGLKEEDEEEPAED